MNKPKPNSRRNKLIGLVVVLILLGLFVYSVQDWHSNLEIVSAPDNVPIVAMLSWCRSLPGWDQAGQGNDNLIGELETDPKLAKTHHRKVEPWRPGWQRNCTFGLIWSALSFCGRHCDGRFVCLVDHP